jgi:hypothetical protein
MLQRKMLYKRPDRIQATLVWQNVLERLVKRAVALVTLWYRVDRKWVKWRWSGDLLRGDEQQNSAIPILVQFLL